MPDSLTVLDAETRAQERPADHKAEVRVWLRLLTCTTLIENEVRSRLRDQFQVTLPRFDLMAQLQRVPVLAHPQTLSQPNPVNRSSPRRATM